MNTTLEAIRAQSPCTEGWLKLTKHLNRETGEVSFATILEHNGIGDACWCVDEILSFDQRRLFIADVAEIVLPIFESSYPLDKRPRERIASLRNLCATNDMVYATTNVFETDTTMKLAAYHVTVAAFNDEAADACASATLALIYKTSIDGRDDALKALRTSIETLFRKYYS